MTDEEILLDDFNAFEDFMENADVEEIKKEHGLSSNNKFKKAFGSCSNITHISDDSITIHIPHKNAIDVPLYHNDEGCYFFVECEYFSKGIAFSDSNNNFYGLLLKEVNSWIIADFPLYPANGIQRYLDLYYKYNPVVGVVQGEIVESAEKVHNRICDNFTIVEKTLYEICVDLKSIRDNKHYKTLGYDTFEQYCLENFNITRRTGSKYLSIGSLPNSFGKSTSHFGAEKLYILSRLTDEERTELIQTTDIEHTPVKQLEQKSKQIKDRKKDVPGDNATFEPEHIKLSDLDKLFVCLDDLKSHLVFEACGDTTFYNVDYLTTSMLKKIKTSILKMQDMTEIFSTILSMKGMGE